MRILWLEQLDPDDLAAVGGKGASLARLAQKGLPVPPGFVVPAAALEQHLRHNGLWERAKAGVNLSAELRDAPLPPTIAGALREGSARLGALLAVRSSGLEEDGGQHSHAGQFHSEIGVAPGDGLERALRLCWASAFAPRVAAYRGHRAGLPRMAVVVQTLVRPRAAGVLFTINPANGSWREMTVEAAWGLGEAVVGGRVVPDFYRVRRPRRTPRPVQRVLARVRLGVEEQVTGSQDRWWVAGPDGATEAPLPASRLGRPCLDEPTLLRLCRLGLRAESLLGGPQDVEWALDEGGTLFLLQSRPVTAAGAVARAGPVVWTRRFVGERWTEPATPLGWSEMRELLHSFIAYPETSRRLLGGEEPTRLVRNAPYINATVFRHLAFKAPGAAPPRFMLELLPPAETAAWLRRRAAPPDLAVYRSILDETFAERRWRRFRWNPLTNWRAWQAFAARLDAEIGAMGPVADRRTARQRVATCRLLARDYIKIHICSLLFANIFYEASSAWLEGRVAASDAALLLQPPADTATARTNAALWELGRGRLDLEPFLADFGHRASSSWELFSPRWRERPALALELAQSAAQAEDPRPAAAQRHAAVALRLATLPAPTAALVRLTRRYLQLREDQRFQFDRLLWAWKQALLWLEADLGLALRFLEKDELEAVLDGSLSHDAAAGLIGPRQAAFAAEERRWAAGDEPPTFLLGEAADAEAPPGHRLSGQGISAGVVTGPARILRDLGDAARLRPGDILIARATDPGWTPLFHVAGGLVMELGGMLSHGAVVAREYGLPAIVGVPDVTRRVEDGRMVTVDGSRGVLWLR